MDPRQMTFTADETLSLLTEKAKTAGDRFVVKVSRRGGINGLLEHIATLGDATLEQVANPETWLPNLCGGGEFSLRVSHADSMSQAVGGFLTYKFPGDRVNTPRISQVGGPGWVGPGIVMFPSKNGGVPEPAPQPQPQVGVTMSQGYGAPPQPGYPGVPVYPAFDPALEAKREALMRQERELAEAKAKADRQLQDREFEVREKEREGKLKAEFTAQLASVKENNRGPEALIGAVAPIVATVMQSMQQSRIEMMKMQEEQSRRNEESARRQTEMMMEMQKQTQTLMMKMMENKGPDPMVTAMLEIQKASSQGNAEMMTRMVDAMGTVSKTSIGMVEVLADLQLGGAPEHPMLAAVKEGVKAMATLSKGAENGARKVAQQKQPSLPQRGVQQPAPQQAAPPRKAEPVYEVPNAPPPNVPPATETQGFAGIEPSTRIALVEGQVVETLKNLIQSKHEPIEDVAQFFLDAAQGSPEMRAALAKVDNNVEQLVAEHLGLWVMADDSNREYVGRLWEALKTLAPDAFSDEPADEDEEVSEEA